MTRADLSSAGTERHPLAGWRVVVTGDAGRVSELGQRVTELGADVVHLAVVTIDDPPDGGAALAEAVARLLGGDYGWVLVTSANAVDRVARSLAGRPVPASVRWAAVGPSTRRALEQANLPCHLAPSVATADALATALEAAAAPARALYPRAERVRSDLAERLRAVGWTVDEVVAYRTRGAPVSPTLLDAVRAADAVLFTSGSAVEHTVASLQNDAVPPVVVTIGPSTSAVARECGLEVSAEAEPHSAAGLVDALVRVARAASD